jgi:hypothetical protein
MRCPVIKDARDRREHVIGWVAPTQDLKSPFAQKGGRYSAAGIGSIPYRKYG